MIELGKIDEIINRLNDSLPPGADRLRKDVERRLRTVLKSVFEKMELVTREEFDVQASVLERAMVKLKALERQLEELEQS